jgi:hypothetical protein
MQVRKLRLPRTVVRRANCGLGLVFGRFARFFPVSCIAELIHSSHSNHLVDCIVKITLLLCLFPVFRKQMSIQKRTTYWRDLFFRRSWLIISFPWIHGILMKTKHGSPEWRTHKLEQMLFPHSLNKTETSLAQDFTCMQSRVSGLPNRWFTSKKIQISLLLCSLKMLCVALDHLAGTTTIISLELHSESYSSLSAELSIIVDDESRGPFHFDSREESLLMQSLLAKAAGTNEPREWLPSQLEY